MPTKTSHISSDSSFALSHLLTATYSRWKERFVHYVLAYLFFGLVWLALTLGLFLCGALITLIIAVFLKSTAGIAYIVGGILLLWCLGTMYVAGLIILTTVSLLTQKTHQGIFATIRTVKPLVLGYLWVGISSAFFLLGFLPFGLLTFFLIPLLWTFWSSFTTFVYLHHKKGGIHNLWISRAMYNQKFWPLVGRSLLPFLGSLFLAVPHMAAIAFFHQQTFGYMLLYVFSYLLNFLYASIVICYNYELYSRLEKPGSVKAPKLWIGVSLLGWIMNLLLMFGLAVSITHMIPALKRYYLTQTIHSQTSFTHNPDTTYISADISQPVQLPDRILTVTSVQDPFPATPNDGLSFSEKFILINVTIENVSQQPITYSPYDFFLIDSMGYLQGPSFAFHVADAAMLGSGELLPGAKKTGAVVCKVTTATQPFILLYQPHIFPGKQEAVEINL